MSVEMGDMANIGREMAVGVFAFAGVHDRDLAALVRTGLHHQHASVTGLPATERVKNGTVQRDALRGDGSHGGRTFDQIGVGAEKIKRHAGQ